MGFNPPVLQGPTGDTGPTGPSGPVVGNIFGASPDTYGFSAASYPNAMTFLDTGGSGNLWIGDTSTWTFLVSVNGTTGPQGVQGVQGVQGEPGTGNMHFLGNWDSGTSYVPNEVVRESSTTYLCVNSHSSDNPTNNSGNWREI